MRQTTDVQSGLVLELATGDAVRYFREEIIFLVIVYRVHNFQAFL